MWYIIDSFGIRTLSTYARTVSGGGIRFSKIPWKSVEVASRATQKRAREETRARARGETVCVSGKACVRACGERERDSDRFLRTEREEDGEIERGKASTSHLARSLSLSCALGFAEPRARRLLRSEASEEEDAARSSSGDRDLFPPRTQCPALCYPAIKSGIISVGIFVAVSFPLLTSDTRRARPPPLSSLLRGSRDREA